MMIMMMICVCANIVYTRVRLLPFGRRWRLKTWKFPCFLAVLRILFLYTIHKFKQKNYGTNYCKASQYICVDGNNAEKNTHTHTKKRSAWEQKGKMKERMKENVRVHQTKMPYIQPIYPDDIQIGIIFHVFCKQRAYINNYKQRNTKKKLHTN